jgi:hypothetical protein
MNVQPDTHIAHYLVLYADVLGQRERLRDLKGVPSSIEAESEAMQVLRDTAGFLVDLRGTWQVFFKEVSAERLEQIDDPALRAAVRQATAVEVSCRFFSDSIIVAVCLADDGQDGCKPMNGVQAALYSCAFMHLTALSLGKAIRGGIDVGWGIPLPDGDIYGAALERAVHLEAEVASYPRVAIGRELQHYIDVTANLQARTAFGKYATEIAKCCQQMLFVDHDGQLALDFLGPKLKEYDSAVGFQQLVQNAYGFVNSEWRRWRETENTKLALRYGWLRSYFLSRADVWGITV